METRAHHLLIGSFAIGISVMTVLFLMWIGKFEFNRQYEIYMLRFEGSVSGLGMAADVLYNGIKVGEVIDLKLDPKDPSHVLVQIQVERTTPVKTDSYASLETQGLTGVAAILIAGGSSKAEKIPVQEGEYYPFIETRKSDFQKLFAGAPELINRGNAVLDGCRPSSATTTGTSSAARSRMSSGLPGTWRVPLTSSIRSPAILTALLPVTPRGRLLTCAALPMNFARSWRMREDP